MKRIFKYLIIVVALLPLLWACHNPLHFAEGKMHRVTIYLKNSQPGAPIATRAIGAVSYTHLDVYKRQYEGSER